RNARHKPDDGKGGGDLPQWTRFPRFRGRCTGRHTRRASDSLSSPLLDRFMKQNAGLDGLKPLLLDLVGPRERRRPEMLIALQMLATFAGLPAGCDSRECRRRGTAAP